MRECAHLLPHKCNGPSATALIGGGGPVARCGSDKCNATEHTPAGTLIDAAGNYLHKITAFFVCVCLHQGGNRVRVLSATVHVWCALSLLEKCAQGRRYKNSNWVCGDGGDGGNACLTLQPDGRFLFCISHKRLPSESCIITRKICVPFVDDSDDDASSPLIGRSPLIMLDY